MKAAIALLLFSGTIFGCDCKRRQTICAEVNTPGVIFIGTVETMAPHFTSRWSPMPRPNLRALNQANEHYLADRTPANFSALKDAFRKVFPSLPDEERKLLDSASEHSTIVALFSSVLTHGQLIHLRVRSVFRNDGDDDDDTNKKIDKSKSKSDATTAGDDDDQDKSKPKSAAKPAKDDHDDDDEVKAPESFDVWTPFGDCGVDFQTGETYLVYAASDEESGVLETDSCTRTRRLTDAGDDLAYLYFFKDHKNPAGRLEGFTTFDPLYQVHQANRPDPDRIDQPAAGVVVELKSPAGIRYTIANGYGQFAFDALGAGEYQVSAYAAGFPETVKLLAGPKTFRTEARACVSQTLLIPKDGQGR